MLVGALDVWADGVSHVGGDLDLVLRHDGSCSAFPECVRTGSEPATYGTVTFGVAARPQSSSSRNGSSWVAYQARSWSCASPTVSSASSSPKSARSTTAIAAFTAGSAAALST